MKVLGLLSFITSVLICPGCLQKSSQDKTDEQTKNIDDAGLLNNLEGTWRLLAAKWGEIEMEEEKEIAIKIFTQNRFAVIRYSEEQNEFIGASGGSYIQLGEEFTEYSEYNTWDASLVGKPQKFSFEFDDDLLYQKGFIKGEIEPEHRLEEVYERLEPGSSLIHDKHPIVGVWKLNEWANGDRVAPEPLPDHELAYKIITPKYFYVVRYNNKTGQTFGVSVGKHQITTDYYIETIDFYTYDPSNNGKQYTFNYQFIDNSFIQSGIIDSDGGYMNYKIEEYYSRVQ